jgi:hypothetical protein
MTILKTFAIAAAAFALAGCASHKHLVDQDNRSQDGTLVVSVDPGEVLAGDKLSIFETRCESARRIIRGEPLPICRNVEVGQARVVELLSDSKARVRIDQPVALSEKTRFKKMN